MLVPAEGLAPALRLVGEGLGRMIADSGDETPAGVAAALTEGRYQLWMIGLAGQVAAALITRVEERPTGRVLACSYAEGKDVDAWKQDFHAAASAFGREVGCSRMEITGREGWLRKLAAIGWVKVAAVYQVGLDQDG